MISKPDYQEVITGVYQTHNPEKVKDVPELLKKYEGQEDALLQSILDKYNLTKHEALNIPKSKALAEKHKRRSRRGWAIVITMLVVIVVLSFFHYVSNKAANEEVNSEQVSDIEQGQDYEKSRIDPASSVVTTVTASERKQILNLLRSSVESDLKQKVKFVVLDIKKCNELISLVAKPVTIDGSPIDYSKTKYSEPPANQIHALFRTEPDGWLLFEYRFSEHSLLPEWKEKFGLGECANHLNFQ